MANISRRGFLVGVGAVASPLLAWGIGRASIGSGSAPSATPAAGCCAYVDYHGWVVTPADRQKLLAHPRMTLFEDTDLPGGDIASRKVSTVDACEAWCVSDARCASFSYGTGGPPATAASGLCRIKSSAEITPVSKRFVTSGVRPWP